MNNFIRVRLGVHWKHFNAGERCALPPSEAEFLIRRGEAIAVDEKGEVLTVAPEVESEEVAEVEVEEVPPSTQRRVGKRSSVKG